MDEKQNGNITLFNIEVPKEVIDEKKQPPKNMQKKPAKKPSQTKKTRTETQKPVKRQPPKKPVEEKVELPKAKPEPEVKEELSQSSLDMLADLEAGLKKEEEEKAAKKMEEAAKKNIGEIIAEEPVPAKKPLQKRKVAKKTAPPKKLATEEAKKASKEKAKKPPITEIKLPYMENKAANSKDWNDGARPVRKNKNLSKFLSWIIPTHGDEMTEIIRKGLVIICIVVLIFSMGILFKSTRLEKKASEKNAGTYFVNKYVQSYDIYKDKEN